MTATSSGPLPRAQMGAEPQLLLTSLLGDFWYWRDEHIPSAALVALLGRVRHQRRRARGRRCAGCRARPAHRGAQRADDRLRHPRPHVRGDRRAHPPDADLRHDRARLGRAVDRGHLLGPGERARGAQGAAGTAAGPALRRPLRRGLGEPARPVEQARATALRELDVPHRDGLARHRAPGRARRGGPVEAFDLEPLARGLPGLRRALPSRCSPRWRPAGSARPRRCGCAPRCGWTGAASRRPTPTCPPSCCRPDLARGRAQRVFAADLRPPRPARRAAVPPAAGGHRPRSWPSSPRHHDSATVAELFAQLGERRARGDTAVRAGRRRPAGSPRSTPGRGRRHAVRRSGRRSSAEAASESSGSPSRPLAGRSVAALCALTCDRPNG